MAASDANAQPRSGGGLVKRTMGLFKRYKRVVQVGVLALIAVFLVKLFLTSWPQLSAHPLTISWGLLVAGFALLVAQELSYAFIWRGILARMGYHLDIVSSQRIYLGAEFVRYIPGNVWHVITRVLWAEQRGVPKANGFASMVIELATKITAAALVFALSLFFWGDLGTLPFNAPSYVLVIAGAILVPLLLLGLQPRLLRGLLNFGLRKLGREPVSFSLSYLDVLLVTLYWALSWVVAGIGFYLVVRSLVPNPAAMPALAPFVCIGIYAIGWDIGFVSFITPSGIGFREAVIVALLTASLLGNIAAGAAIALVIAFATRLLGTAAEIVCIAAAYAVRGVPPLPKEASSPAPFSSAEARGNLK